MIRRLLSFLFLGWILGFAWFALFLPQPWEGGHTDAIVVLTGGPGRIDRGIDLLEAKKAERMLISGVDPDVKPHELVVEYDARPSLFACCITLGREAIDTRSNAMETADWVKRYKYRSIRLITTDWHMRRAAYELSQAMPHDVMVHFDAVPSHPSLAILFKEYNKYVLRRAAGLIGI